MFAHDVNSGLDAHSSLALANDCKTLWLGAVQPHWDESFVFSYAGNPKKDLLHSDQVTVLQHILRSNLTCTQWDET